MIRLSLFDQFLVILLLSLCFPACSNENRQTELGNQLLQSRLEERLETVRKIRRTECAQQLLDSARYLVDSIWVLEALRSLDTLQRPFKPDKPLPPPANNSLETLVVNPLFPDSIKPLKGQK
jgi:hypothetical protein